MNEPAFDDFARETAGRFLNGDDNPSACRLLAALERAFDETFLNYTEASPGHWSHPHGEWTGQLDRPSCGVPVILAFLSARRAGAGSARLDDRVRCYHQFLAAMATRFDPVDTAFAHLSAQCAACVFPGEPQFSALADALGVREASSAAVSASPALTDARRIAALLFA